MATPHVTGVAALAAGYDPTASIQDIKAALLGSADPIPALAGVTVSGGRLNAQNTLQALGLRVVGSSPAPGEALDHRPTDFVIDLSAAYDPTTVDAQDLTVNGQPADAVVQTDGDTLSFHFGTSPVVAQGVQQMQVAEGAIQRAMDGEPIGAWSVDFFYDAFPMQVVSTEPADGSVAELPLSQLRVHFSEPFAPASVGADDLAIGRGSVRDAIVVDGDTVDYLIDGIANEGLLTIDMAAGALIDPFGNPTEPYHGNLVLDYGVLPVPLPLEATAPAGSLVYERTIDGIIGSPGDADRFTLNATAGQTIAVVVDPAGGLTPSVDLYDVAGQWMGGGTSAGPDQGAVLRPVAALDAGTYTVAISGQAGSTGSYAARTS